MAGVSWHLARASLIHPLSFILLLLSGVFLYKYRLNTTWLILAGALAGFLFHIG
jgi:chromate transporter